MRKRNVILLVGSALVIGTAAFILYIFFGGNIFADAEKKVFFVSKGESWEQVVDSMALQGILRNKDWFNLVVDVSRKGKQTVVGKYEFESGVSNAKLYAALRTGKAIVPIPVTLVEGRRMLSFCRTLHRTLGIDSIRFMNLVNDPAFVHSLGVDATNLEGYLAPNTYNFNWQTDEEEIVRRLVTQTQTVFDDSLMQRAKEMNLTMHQVLTLASIIEGETVVDDERAIISGVYHNRLRKGMRLQADPTIQYIIPDAPRRVYYSDLVLDNPYNTYRNSGLPPGPIGNPGAESIVAALYPAKHNYLFFVANRLGGHWFSTNYADHMNFVKKYRRGRAGRNQSMS